MNTNARYPRTRRRALRCAVIGFLVEGVLLFAFFWLQDGGRRFIPHALWLKVTLALVLFLCSNVAGGYIVGWYKDYFLWPRAGAHPEGPEKSLHEWWRQQPFHSTLSSQLGFIERVVVTVAGLISFEWFFIACGGWLTLKTAVEWQQHSEMKYRVINHIYLISSVLSLMSAIVDVALIRTLFGLTVLPK